MRALTLIAGSLLFALGGCTGNPPPTPAQRGPGATSGRDFVAGEDRPPVTTDTGSRLLAAEPLGALVVHTVPTLATPVGPTVGPALGPTTSATIERPGAPEPRVVPAAQPDYRPPPLMRVPIAPPPPPPPPPAFPPPVKPTTPPPGSQP